MSWKPQFESKPWKGAVAFYGDMLKKYGPPNSTANSSNEILKLFNDGKCAMWVDTSIVGSFVADPRQSKMANKVAFAQAPSAVTDKGASWLWAWALAISSDKKKVEEGGCGAEFH